MDVTIEQYCEWVDRNETVERKQVWRELKAGEGFWNEVLATRPQYTAAVVVNRNLPDSILEKLSKHPQWRIRCSVAEKRQCPVELLKVLAGDMACLVRSSVARNKKTPREILELLKDDSDWTVGKQARARLRKMDGIPETVVSHRAYSNLKYRHAGGVWDGAIRNEGDWIFLTIRGVEFGGHCFECLTPVKGTDPGKLSLFALNRHNELCGCTIEVESELLVEVDGRMETGRLAVQVLLVDPETHGDKNPNRVKLELKLGERVYRTPSVDGGIRFKEELLDIQKQLPEGAYIKSCLTCELSDYSLNRNHMEGKNILGTLACFRENPRGVLNARTEEEWMEEFYSLTGFVKETSVCWEYRRRTPGRGYRG